MATKHVHIFLAAWISKIVTVIARFFTLPLILSYLGVENYAIFAVIVSLEGWFLLSDFGMGSSIQNFLAEKRALNEPLTPTLQATTYIVLTLFSLVFPLILMIIPILGPFLLGNLVDNYSFDTRNLLFLAGSFYFLLALTNVGYKALFAYQKGHLVHILQGAATLISMGLTLLLRYFYEGEYKLFYILLATASIPALISFSVFFHLFLKRSHFALPSFEMIKMILSRSFRFWLLALLSAFALLIDYFIMARTLSSKDIVIYNVLSKIFAMVFVSFHAVLDAFCPTSSGLLTQLRWDEVHLLVKKSYSIGSLFVIVATTLVLIFSTTIGKLLLPDSLILSEFTILLFGLHTLIRVFADSYAMVLHSMSFFSPFFIFLPLQALLSGICQYFLSLKFGINGILFGLMISFLFSVSWGLPREYYRQKRLFRRAEE